MPRLIVFNHVSLDGFFTDAHGDMSWAHRPDPEWNEFAAGNASGDSRLLFGRVTYQLMAGYWPTEAARKNAPVVAEAMGQRPKVVFSTTLTEPLWQNTRLVTSDLTGEVRRLKADPGPDLVILGSGSVVSQLAEARLIDDYQLVVNPLILGKGRSLFESVTAKQPLELTATRRFGNGNVLLSYQPG